MQKQCDTGRGSAGGHGSSGTCDLSGFCVETPENGAETGIQTASGWNHGVGITGRYVSVSFERRDGGGRRIMERVIVTGATSMIGEALIEECLKHGISVCAVIRKDTARKDRLPQDPHLELVECSLEELAALPEKVTGSFDTFYHIAWGYTGAARNKSTRLQSKNIDYTLDAVEAAAKLGCKRFIGAGSQAEYGPLDREMIGPDAPEHPTTPYGVSKLAAGKLSKLLCKELGIEWIWPRIFSVYGIYDKESTMVMTAIHQFLAEEETAFTPGEQEWDYLYSKDAGRAFYLIGEKGRDGSIYCVGSGKARRLYEYIYQIRDVANPKATPGIGKKSYGVQPVMHLCADISSLKNDTGFEPAYEFSSGIREMVRWMKEKDK